MIRALLVVVLVAFTLASGGVHKLANGYGQTNSDTASAQLASVEIIEQCCNTADDEAGIEKPRCLGDNCISSISALLLPEGYGDKLRILSAQDLGHIQQKRFLRPPIS